MSERINPSDPEQSLRRAEAHERITRALGRLPSDAERNAALAGSLAAQIVRQAGGDAQQARADVTDWGEALRLTVEQLLSESSA